MTYSRDNEPEWLKQWRERKAQINPDDVSTTMKPFGVVRKTIKEIIELAKTESQVVFVFVSGNQKERNAISKKLAKAGVHVISYTKSLAETRDHKGSPDEYQLGGLAWSIIRADVSRFIAKDKSIVISAEVTGHDQMQRLTKFGFISGARAVIAICITTMYEEGWDDDGFTGVIWFQQSAN